MKINNLISTKLLNRHGLSFLLILIPVLTFGQKADEYQVKSAYLEKVTRFISWPNDRNLAQKDTFVIGIVGENPFGKSLHSYFKNQDIKGKAVKIILINGLDDIAGCDLLFIAKSEKNNLDKYILEASLNNVLTVSDTKGYSENGVHVNLPVEGVRIKLQVNYECLKQSGFKVESVLLAYAEIVVCNSIQKGGE